MHWIPTLLAGVAYRPNDQSYEFYNQVATGEYNESFLVRYNSSQNGIGVFAGETWSGDTAYFDWFSQTLIFTWTNYF